jgi:hypothetical protein
MAHLFGRNYTKAELLRLVGDMSQLAAVRRAELTEGNERGAGLIEVSNASGLHFSVLPGRALDIAAATYRGRSLCFRSATGDVGPAFYDPQGYGWMRGFFGGLLISCGLTFVGHPETDPEEEDEELGLHGRLSAIPAREVSAGGSWHGDDYRLHVAGVVREAAALGTTLELRREISTTLGERRILIHDRVENLSGVRSPLMLLYHTNPGFPLLDEGTRFLVNSRLSTEWLHDRPVDSAVYERAGAPQPGAGDDVYVHRPRPAADGTVTVALVNDRLAFGLQWRFPAAEMPLVTQWQHFANAGYVTGVEPGNCSPLGRAWNRRNGSLEYLEPGAVREFHLEITVLDGADDIAAAERRVTGRR